MGSHPANPAYNFLYTLEEQMYVEGYEQLVEQIWNQLIEGIDQPLEDTPLAAHLSTYRQHLPLDPNVFFTNWCKWLPKVEELPVSAYQMKYIMVMIYYYNTELHLVEDPVIVLVARLFFLICTLQPTNVVQERVQIQRVFQEVLNSLEVRLPRTHDVPLELMREIGNFLHKKLMPNDELEHLLTYICKIAVHENIIIYKSFGAMKPSEMDESYNYFAYSALFLATKNRDAPSEYKRNIMTTIIFFLMDCLDEKYHKGQPPVLLVNIKNFLKFIIGDLNDRSWIIALIISCGLQQPNSIHFLDFVNSLQVSTYEKLTFHVAREFAQNVENRDALEELMYTLVTNPHPAWLYQSRKEFTQHYFKTILLLVETTDDAILEFALRKIKKCVEAKDDILSKCVKKLMTKKMANANPLFHKTFKILHRRTDRQWCRKTINIVFLDLMWTLFLKYHRNFDKPTLKEMEDLIDIASAADILDILPIINDVIKFCIPKNFELATFLFKILTKHALMSTRTAVTYLKEVYELTFKNIIGEKVENVNAFKLTEYMMSSEIDYSSLIKKMANQQYLQQVLLDHILTICLFEREGIWPIAIALMKVFEYSGEIPWGITHHFLKSQEEIFSYKDLRYVLSCLVIIYQAHPQKMQENFAQLTLARNLYHGFSFQCFTSENLNVAVQLTELISLGTLHSVAWLIALHKTWCEKLLHALKSKSHKRLAKCNLSMLYITELPYLTNSEMEEELYNEIKDISISENLHKYLRIPDSWSLLLILYSKICSGRNYPVEHCMEAISFSIQHGPREIKHTAILCLHDICICLKMDINIYLDILFEFMSTTNNQFSLCFALERALKYLISHDYHVLEYSRYFELLRSILEVKSSPRMMYFIMELVGKLMNKYERGFSGHFNQYLLHLNGCTTSFPGLISSLPPYIEVRTYALQKKLILYRHLFSSFSDNNCYNIMRHMASQVIDPIINGDRDGMFVSELLSDCCSVINIICLKKYKGAIGSNVLEFFEEAISFVRDHLLATLVPNAGPVVGQDNNDKIKRVLLVLFKLLYRTNWLGRDLMQDVFFTIILLIKTFQDNIPTIVSESTTELQPMLKRLENFYTQNKVHMRYVHIGVNLDHWLCT